MNLENLIEKLIKKIPGSDTKSEEQINKKLDSIEYLLLNNNIKLDTSKENINKPSKKKEEDEIEVFIPSVDIDNLNLKGETTKTTIKQDNTNLESVVELLSNIGK